MAAPSIGVLISHVNRGLTTVWVSVVTNTFFGAAFPNFSYSSDGHPSEWELMVDNLLYNRSWDGVW